MQKVIGEACGRDKPCVPPKDGDGERMGRGERHSLPFWQAWDRFAAAAKLPRRIYVFCTCVSLPPDPAEFSIVF